MSGGATTTGERGPAIIAEDLRRTFRVSRGWIRRRTREVEAVRGVSLRVERGELFGLLGPNGAGKTTTIKMLNTLLLPTAGTARVLGHDVRHEVSAVRRRIGYVSGGDRGLYDRLSALDNLRYFADLYGVPPREQGPRIGELLDLVSLSDRRHDRVEGYSRGMRQRLHLARGLLHRPEVLFLDEPSLGVDPVAARDLRRIVAELCARGTTVLLTTHYMAEADELCGRIAVIADGLIQAEGTPAELKARVTGQDIVEIEVYGVRDDALADLRALPGVLGVGVEERGHLPVLTVHTTTGGVPHSAVLRTLGDTRTGRITDREPTLEDAYVAIVSGVRAAADAEATGQAQATAEGGASTADAEATAGAGASAAGGAGADATAEAAAAPSESLR
jgi:ABC-2 type transport system ATP-binding protein